ncbi:MAG TPA: 2Fe-2S iron-sulfur cluster-binding protein [Phycisphaerae bacterium]|jgi:predicted molibdopterin-dependent oxidoreductase YjgC|nr:2Fe-2S iron-sulfur cluster-binding protein [Phycisphaerae bacterium]
MANAVKEIAVLINGKRVEVAASTTVAAAIAQAGIAGFRTSVRAEPRAPLCGMGICLECRVSINGRANLRSCNIYCTEGMEIRTDG